MLKTLPLLSAALAILLLPWTVSAEDKKDGPPRRGPAAMFDKLDENDDGTISKDEISEKAPDRLKEMLKKSDADGDGKVTREEFRAATKERMEAMKKRVEQRRKDGPARRKPGAARRGRHPGPPKGGFKGRRPGRPGMRPQGPPRVPSMPKAEEIFKKFDKNGDGQLSKEEFVAGAKKVQERMKHMLHHRRPPHHARRAYRGAPHRGAPHHGAPHRGRHPRGPAAERKPSKDKAIAKKIIERIKEADKDDDGKISKEEAPDRLKKHFDKVDKNDDGYVDKAEVRGMLRHRKQAQRRGGPDKSSRGPKKDKKENKEKN
ncbi:MAG: EF-hand domain-containing protein [Planctomycetota bacterium]